VISINSTERLAFTILTKHVSVEVGMDVCVHVLISELGFEDRAMAQAV